MKQIIPKAHLLLVWVLICCSISRESRANAYLIAHRGAPFYAPEHTLASYHIAYRQGADYIEPDLVMTKDHEFIVVHDLGLNSTTNVWEFPQFRSRARTIDFGDSVHEGGVTDVFAFDLTLAEIKLLRVKQRISSRSALFNGLFEIPTFTEVLQLIRDLNTQFGTNVGIYPECKSPFYLETEQNLHFTDKLLGLLQEFNYTDANSNIYIQSFDVDFLKRLHQKTSIKLVQLVDSPLKLMQGSKSDYGLLLTPEGVSDVATYATALSPWKGYFYPWVSGEGSIPFLSTSLRGKMLVDEAHKHKLEVVTWTIRNNIEDPALKTYFEGDPKRELAYLMEMGIDAFFVEDLPPAVEAQHLFRSRTTVQACVCAPPAPNNRSDNDLESPTS